MDCHWHLQHVLEQGQVMFPEALLCAVLQQAF